MVTSIRSNQEKKFKGLLECPLARGFVEFEYSEGDLVSELLARVTETWGEARLVGRDAEIFDVDGWSIACQMAEETYILLKRKDPIPIKPPASSEEALSVGSFGRGTIHFGIKRLGKTPLNIFIDRDYELPKSKYAIHLLALAAISGG